MYIKGIVLDGFKSYASRTEVNGFHPLFNAITGLNGSGKSNILDSICFLLGITNLSHVRATNLQQLIYKSGQKGVTKATVTITFDNTDKDQSPMGYETFEEITISRQIVLGGRNKYLINGCNANNTRVQDLFRSVQLNVNNPHFLIMQGRITKVLNMKPPEILSMIEEAAGTRMYESKKQQAMKTMEKKQSKLNEMEAVFNEEITPTIRRLKEERSSFLEYQKVMRVIEHLTRLYVAYEFTKAEEIKEKSGSDLDKMNNSIKELKERSRQVEDEMSLIDQEIVKLQKKKDSESGNVFKELEKRLDEVEKVEVKATSDVKHATDTLNAEKKKRTQIQKAHVDSMSQLEAKVKMVEKLQLEIGNLEERSTKDASAVMQAQNHYHAVSAGLSSNDDGEDKTLADQLMECKNAISKAETEIKQAQIKINYEENELKKKKADLKSTAKSYEHNSSSLASLKKDITKIENQIQSLNYKVGFEEELTERKRHLKSEVEKFQNIVESIEGRNPSLAFQYNDPEPKFNRSKVKGTVASLIKVNDVKYATALQVTAGSKLFFVVVDTEKTGKQLLQNGGLKRKVSLIPMNKIAAKVINSDVVKRAKSIVGEANVDVALTLVGYDNELEAAMQFVFGAALVATDMESAKKTAFDPNVKKKTVTLEGDVFDPAGTLSGGARSNRSSILVTVQELHDAREKLQKAQDELQKVEKELGKIQTVVEKFNKLRSELDMKILAANLAEEKLKQSTHHQKVEELEAFQASIDEQKRIIVQGNETIENASKKSKDLEYKMEKKSAHREKELKVAENALLNAKEKADFSKKDFKAKQQKLEEVNLEIEALTVEITGLEEQANRMDENLLKINEEIERLSVIAEEKKTAMLEAKKQLEEQKETLRKCSESIASKSMEKGQLLKETSNNQLKLKELEHTITKIKKETQDAIQKVNNMLEKYSWITTERQYFGQANTAFDFEANDPKEAAIQLIRLNETKEKLSKSVNMRAMNMLGKAEEKYNDLMKKKRIVENDKKKIEEVIADLDEKKNEALRIASTKVNKDFGSIFSTLLPGANAKLAPLEGMTVLDGLEVKVAFGNVWKESLTELSGGQRSLVALSLILSMLLFKPAPIYILDEVDAALDLSHTQNIGQMLRQHFRHSQFIVVSLKDGMFNNANVLFKTKFVDGVSTVNRFVQNTSTKEKKR